MMVTSWHYHRSNHDQQRLRSMARMVVVLMVMMTFMMVTHFVAAALPSPASINIGLLLASNISDLPVQRAIACVQLALADIKNETTIFDNVSVTLYINDSSTVASATRSADWLTHDGDVTVMINTAYSLQSVPISYAATATYTPMVSTLSAANEFSSSDLHPMFTRVTQADMTTGGAVLAMMERYGWTKANLLHTSEPYGRGLGDWLIANAKAPISFARASFAQQGGDEQLMRDIEGFVASQIYILIIQMPMEDMTRILPILLASPLAGPQYVWIGTAWPQMIRPWSMTLRNQLAGYIALAPTFEVTQRVIDFDARANALYPGLFNMSTMYALDRDYTPYDAMRIIALALDDLWHSSLPNTGINLRDAIRAQVYDGLVGKICFNNASNGDIYGRRTIYNMVGGELVEIGSWTADNGSVLVIHTAPIWMDGNTDIPRDQPGHDEDSQLSLTHRGDSMVLSFGVGVLGSWTCLIVTEQAIAYQRKASSYGSYAYIGWLLISAIALGCCGVWGLTMIGISAVDIADLNMYFHPLTCGLALLYATVLAFLSLWLQLWSAHRIRISLVMRVPAVRPSQTYAAAQAAAAAVVSQQGYNGSTDKYTHGSRGGGYGSRGHGNGYGGSSGATNGGSSAAGGTMVKVHRVSVAPMCRDSMRYITTTTVAAAFILTAAIVGAYSICVTGVRVAAMPHHSIQVEVISFLACWACVTVIYAAYFHAEHQLWRISAAFALAVVIFSIHQIQAVSLKWTYSSSLIPSTTDTNGYWSDGTINLLVSVLSASVCFVFIGINISSLRLSRNLLDRLLAQMQKQMSKLEHNLMNEKKLVRAAQLEADESRRNLELINFCRPHIRNHAIAITMAGKAETGSKDKGENYNAGPNVSRIASVSRQNMQQLSQLEASRLGRGRAIVSQWSQGLTQAKSDRDVMSLLNELNGPIHLEGGPVAERALSDVKLPQLLGHPVTLEIIKDTLLRTLSSESVTLLLDIQRYRNLDLPIARGAVAQEMYFMFIQPRSISEVVIPAALKDRVARSLRAGDPRPDLFDEIEAEILRDINQNSMPAFVSTSQFKLCCLILNHPSYKLQRRYVPDQDHNAGVYGMGSMMFNGSASPQPPPDPGAFDTDTYASHGNPTPSRGINQGIAGIGAPPIGSTGGGGGSGSTGIPVFTSPPAGTTRTITPSVPHTTMTTSNSNPANNTNKYNNNNKMMMPPSLPVPSSYPVPAAATAHTTPVPAGDPNNGYITGGLPLARGSLSISQQQLAGAGLLGIMNGSSVPTSPMHTAICAPTNHSDSSSHGAAATTITNGHHSHHHNHHDDHDGNHMNGFRIAAPHSPSSAMGGFMMATGGATSADRVAAATTSVLGRAYYGSSGGASLLGPPIGKDEGASPLTAHRFLGPRKDSDSMAIGAPVVRHNQPIAIPPELRAVIHPTTTTVNGTNLPKMSAAAAQAAAAADAAALAMAAFADEGPTS